jgi:type II secretory pathway pseudopilin PulG
LIGAGYSRAREFTCDSFGRACCTDAEPAVHGLVALAAGERRWAVLNIPAYLEQTKYTGGFWMSFHELIADYPWIVKRVARIANPGQKMPSLNPLAWVLAIFIPRFGLGGGLANMVIVVAIIGILVAVAIPAYQDYVMRAKMMEVVSVGQGASEAVANYYEQKQALPQSIEETGFTATSPSVRQIRVNPKSGVVNLTIGFSPLEGKSLSFIPSLDADKRVKWRCASDDIPGKFLPPRCRQQ